MTEMIEAANKKQPPKVKVRLNMITALPSDTLTTDPIICQKGEIVEVSPELAQKWTAEKYQKSPNKMCERKGGDFLLPEYITRANYI